MPPFSDASTDTIRKPDTANPYEDRKAISARIDRVLETDRWSHSLFESGFFRNILMIAGAQWIIKDRNNRWRRKTFPFADFPRTYTNKVAEKFNELVGQLVTGQALPISPQPADPDNDKDVATADIAESVLRLVHNEAEIDAKELEVASWLVATGNCFGIPNYDMDPGFGIITMPHSMCPQCQTIFTPEEMQVGESCPLCNQPTIPATDDETGDPLVDEYPRGALQLEVVSPFEIRLDHRFTDVRKMLRFVRQRRYDLDWVKEHWDGKPGPDGVPIDASKFSPDQGSDDPGQYYMDVLSNVTSAYRFGAGLFNNNANASTKTPKLTAFEFYELPTEDYPEGIRAVRLGRASADNIVEAGPLKSQYGAGVRKGQTYLPLIHWGYQRLPGRLWYKTPLDDVIPLQVTRNVVEANINITVQRMGNPVWLNPKGSGVEIITGESGQVIPYNPVSVGGTQFARPERIPAELNNLAPLIGWMTKIDDAIERLAGTFFLQGGQAPPGVTAASALAYLGEKGQQSLSTLRANWAKSWRDFDLMALEIARDNWDDERIAVIAGKNKQWQAQVFTKADLQGAIDIVIDYNALPPKSTATEQAKISQLTQLGMVNPQDDEVKIEVLKRFGAIDLIGSRSLDLQYAAKVQDRFRKDPAFVPQVRPNIDNSFALMLESVNFAKTDEFDALPPDRQQLWLQYCDQLGIAVAKRRQEMAALGLNPDAPGLGSVPEGELEAALGQAQQQSGGQASGQMAPDPRLDANGQPMPTSDQMAQQQPDIADGTAGAMNVSGNEGPAVKPPGAPRRINLPANG